MKQQFVHLHVHTEYSLLDGHARIKKLVQKAVREGQTAMAITDHGYLYGAMEFYHACKAAGIKPIIGIELYTAENVYNRFAGEKRGHIVLLAKNQTGYQNLLKLASFAATEGFYHKPRVDMKVLEKYHEGLICLSACLAGEIPTLLLQKNYEAAKEKALAYKEIFGEDFYIELQYHGLQEQKDILKDTLRLSKDCGIELVATNDVHYLEKEDAFAQRVLMCMSMKKTLAESELDEYTGEKPAQWYFKTADEMALIWGKIAPQALTNTLVIADKCNVSLEQTGYHLPKFPAPEGYDSNEQYFEAVAKKGLLSRYGEKAMENLPRLNYEMETIKAMGFVDYFLIVSDFIRYAKENRIPVGPGRGSAAGSIVSYCLEITDIDPVANGLLFERFLNPERITMPDIDIDFDVPDGRESVISYVAHKYGAMQVARIASFGTLAARSAIADVAKVLEVPAHKVSQMKRCIPAGKTDITLATVMETSNEMKKLCDEDADIAKVMSVAQSVEGLYRHTSTHAAGVIIAPSDMSDYIPIMRGDAQPISQFAMESVENAHMVKMDFLGLKTLTILQNAEDDVNTHHGTEATPFSLKNIPMDDSQVYAMLAEGESAGVFQLESEGMKSVLKLLKPTCFEDLVSVIALYRPGPMDSIPKFVDCKHNPSKISYLHPLLEPILKDTYGCCVFQEQIMAIVRELAGYSYGRSDLVRRTMSKKKADKMLEEKAYFLYGKKKPDGTVECEGCIARGIPKQVAEQIWNEMESFASYAFNRAHAAAYAVIAYQTAYMKCHYPLEFAAAIMTAAIDSQTEGKLLSFIGDCKRQGIQVLPPDINHSQMGFSVEGNAIRFGLLAIKNMGTAVIQEILQKRKRNGLYSGLQDLIERCELVGKTATGQALIGSGALDFSGVRRSQMLAAFDIMVKATVQARKTAIAGQMTMGSVFMADAKAPQETSLDIGVYQYADIPELPQLELLKMEKDTIGVFVSGHPMDRFTEFLQGKVTHQLYQVPPNTTTQWVQNGKVTVAGVIASTRVVTTKKNQQMGFLSLEDQTGTIDVTLFPRLYDSCKEKLADGNAVMISGDIEEDATYGTKLVAFSLDVLA